MFKDYEKKRIWVDGKGNVFKSVADKDPDGEESKLHTDKSKIRLCIDCAKTILDDDGKVIGHYVEKECGFIEVKPVGRKNERCADCERKHRMDCMWGDR
jgi:hypothetical protein